jgi:hypothetical protein
MATNPTTPPAQPDSGEVRDARRRQRFYMVDNDLILAWGRYIKPGGIAVYNALLVHSKNGGAAPVFPGLRRLAELIGVEVPTVLKYIRLLESYGLIQIEHRTRQTLAGTTENVANLYTILDIPDPPEAQGSGARAPEAPPHLPPAPPPVPVAAPSAGSRTSAAERRTRFLLTEADAAVSEDMRGWARLHAPDVADVDLATRTFVASAIANERGFLSPEQVRAAWQKWMLDDQKKAQEGRSKIRPFAIPATGPAALTAASLPQRIHHAS